MFTGVCIDELENSVCEIFNEFELNYYANNIEHTFHNNMVRV